MQCTIRDPTRKQSVNTLPQQYKWPTLQLDVLHAQTNSACLKYTASSEPTGHNSLDYGYCFTIFHIHMHRHHRHFWHATLRLCSAIRRHHPPQRAVLSQICCFGERKVVLFQILLDSAEPRDAGTTWWSSPVCIVWKAYSHAFHIKSGHVWIFAGSDVFSEVQFALAV